MAVRVSFQCRSCHFLSPLDELDVDGSVECCKCVTHQHFDVGAWVEAAAFAHGVADLAYPPPEGRAPNPHIWIGEANPHIRVGYTEPFAEHRQSSVTVQHGLTVHRSLFIQAGPGHPVCPSCERPLRVAVRGQRTATQCDGCGQEVSYQMPVGAPQRVPGVVGVVAMAHRVDGTRAMLDTHGGTATLKCGECGGDIPPQKSRVVACKFCSTTNLVPARARQRMDGMAIEPEVWWLAFSGTSAARAALEAPVVPLDRTDGLGGETQLERAPTREGFNIRQFLLTCAMAAAALVVGVIISQVFGLHRLASF